MVSQYRSKLLNRFSMTTTLTAIRFGTQCSCQYLREPLSTSHTPEVIFPYLSSCSHSLSGSAYQFTTLATTKTIASTPIARPAPIQAPPNIMPVNLSISAMVTSPTDQSKPTVPNHSVWMVKVGFPIVSSPMGAWGGCSGLTSSCSCFCNSLIVVAC